MKNRAMTDEQKEEIISVVLKIWKNNPQVRLGQLLVNAMGGDSADYLFYIEDYDLICKLDPKLELLK